MLRNNPILSKPGKKHPCLNSPDFTEACYEHQIFELVFFIRAEMDHVCIIHPRTICLGLGSLILRLFQSRGV